MAEPANVLGVEAVIFDWGGTLTPWHGIDLRAEAEALAAAAVGSDHTAADLLQEAMGVVVALARPPHQRDAGRRVRARRPDT